MDELRERHPMQGQQVLLVCDTLYYDSRICLNPIFYFYLHIILECCCIYSTFLALWFSPQLSSLLATQIQKISLYMAQ